MKPSITVVTAASLCGILLFVPGCRTVSGLREPNETDKPDSAAEYAAALGGVWEGRISVPVQDLPVIVHIEVVDRIRATIDIPSQGAYGLPLKRVRYEPSRIYLELPAGPGVAVFEGEVSGDVMSGDFRQAGMFGSFELRRTGADAAAGP